MTTSYQHEAAETKKTEETQKTKEICELFSRAAVLDEIRKKEHHDFYNNGVGIFRKLRVNLDVRRARKVFSKMVKTDKAALKPVFEEMKAKEVAMLLRSIISEKVELPFEEAMNQMSPEFRYATGYHMQNQGSVFDPLVKPIVYFAGVKMMLQAMQEGFEKPKANLIVPLASLHMLKGWFQTSAARGYDPKKLDEKGDFPNKTVYRLVRDVDVLAQKVLTGALEAKENAGGLTQDDMKALIDVSRKPGLAVSSYSKEEWKGSERHEKIEKLIDRLQGLAVKAIKVSFGGPQNMFGEELLTVGNQLALNIADQVSVEHARELIGRCYDQTMEVCSKDEKNINQKVRYVEFTKRLIAEARLSTKFGRNPEVAERSKILEEMQKMIRFVISVQQAERDLKNAKSRYDSTLLLKRRDAHENRDTLRRSAELFGSGGIHLWKRTMEDIGGDFIMPTPVPPQASAEAPTQA